MKIKTDYMGQKPKIVEHNVTHYLYEPILTLTDKECLIDYLGNVCFSHLKRMQDKGGNTLVMRFPIITDIKSAKEAL